MEKLKLNVPPKCLTFKYQKTNSMIKKLLFAGAIAILSIASSDAQTLKTPAPSPAATVSQDFGLATIQLSYSRPGMKGRKIFGDVVPFGKVWRTGANEATVFEVSKAVKVEGKSLPAGKYSLYTIPGEKEWTVMINKSWNQSGTEYDQAQDALRFTVKPVKSASFTERMTFKIAKTGVVSLIWGDHQVNFSVK